MLKLGVSISSAGSFCDGNFGYIVKVACEYVFLDMFEAFLPWPLLSFTM